jgi:hypothetical protein
MAIESKGNFKMRKFLYLLRQFGFDPVRTLCGVRFLPKYLISFFRFRSQLTERRLLRISPVLNDFADQAGSADGHYFWQDLICAKWIHQNNPENHLDVGSRIDGFIAHLLTFRKVILLDVRPLNNEIPNLEVVLGDAQKELQESIGRFDSVSSLHSIEHFGLGRYNDRLEVEGHLKGLKNISECVTSKGSLFISFPIGEPRIEFNEQRIIDPGWPESELSDFTLRQFVLIPWKGQPQFGMYPKDVDRSIKGQAGLYWFERN